MTKTKKLLNREQEMAKLGNGKPSVAELYAGTSIYISATKKKTKSHQMRANKHFIHLTKRKKLKVPKTIHFNLTARQLLKKIMITRFF